MIQSRPNVFRAKGVTNSALTRNDADVTTWVANQHTRLVVGLSLVYIDGGTLFHKSLSCALAWHNRSFLIEGNLALS